MAKWVFRWSKRSLLDDQTTARDAWQQAQGYTYAGVNGNGGQTVRRSFAASQPASRIAGPTLVNRDPLSTGNASWTIGVTPLSPDLMEQLGVGKLSNL